MEKVKNHKGWGRPITARKWHYFNDDIFSLCRKWGFYGGETDDSMDNHPDNCAECRRKKAALDQKQAEK